MPQPPIAELIAVQRSLGCVSYQLLVRDSVRLTPPPRIVWMNRAFADIPESHAGCKGRAYAWALKHGYRIVEGTKGQKRRA